MSDATYKGRRVTIWNKSEPEEWDERLNGESWLDMMIRTESQREELERENKRVEIEFSKLIKELQK